MIVAAATLNDVIAHNHLLEMVLERFDVVSAQRNSTLELISKNCGCNLDFLVEILNLFDSEKPFSKGNLEQYDIPVIIDYLQRTHCYYLGKRLFELENSVDTICHKYYNDTLVHTLLHNFFSEFKTELWEHIELEENFLFPHIQFLNTCAPATRNTKWLKRKLQNFSLQQFIADHNDHSETQISELCDMLDYNYPKENTFSTNAILQKK